MTIRNILVYIVLFFFMPDNIMGQADDLCSYWRTIKGNTQIQIYKETNGKYYGKIVWLRIEKDRPDINNPNPKLRNRKVLGMRIMEGFIYNSKNKRWENGTIYDPESGKTYKCSLWFEGNRYLLKLKGFPLGIKMIGRETEWIRESAIRQ